MKTVPHDKKEGGAAQKKREKELTQLAKKDEET